MPSTQRRKGKPLDLIGRIQADYRPEGERIPNRAAHFLDWAAHEFPGVPIPWNIVVKAVMQYRSTPTLSGIETKQMADRASSIRKVLMRDHERGLVNARGQGVRASVSDDDLANTQLRNNVRRLASAKASAEATRALIDPEAMKNRELRAWVKDGVIPALKGLDAVSRLNKLLPPAPPSGEGKP